MGRDRHLSFDLLSALADGEADATEIQDARTHLDACPACAAELASFARVDELLAAPTTEELAWESLRAALAALPSGAPSARTDDRIRQLVRRPVAVPRPSLWPPTPVGIALRGAVAAAVVLAIVLGLLPGQPGAPRQAVVPQPAAQQALVASVQQAVLHSKSNTLYLLLTAQGAVDAVNATTYERRALIAVGGRPSALALNEAADTVLVLDSQSKTLTEIDTGANRIVGTTHVDVSGTPTTLSVDEAGGKIVVGTVVAPPETGSLPTPTPGTSGGQVAIIDTTTKAIEQIKSVDVAVRQVVLDPRGRQTLLVSPDATTVVDASYKTILTLPGGIGAAFDARRDWFAVLSGDAASSKLTFVGDKAPDALLLDGAPAAMTRLPEGGFAILVSKGDRGRIFVVDQEGRASAFVDVDAVGADLEYDARAKKFTVTRDGFVASAPLPAGPVAVPETSPRASTSPAPSGSAQPGASAQPSASPEPGASASPAPTPLPSVKRDVVALPAEAVEIGTDLYRVSLPAGRAPVITANSARHMWFVDRENALDALDIETGVLSRIAVLPRDASIRALGVGPDSVYAADVAKGRLFLLDLRSEVLSSYPLPAVDVSAMAVSPGGVAWIAMPGSSQLLSFTPLTHRFQVVDVGTRGIVALAPDGNRVWFSTGAGLGYYDTIERRATALGWSGSPVSVLLAGRRDTMWVGTATGEVYSVRAGSIALAADLAQPVATLTLDAKGKPWYLAPAAGGGFSYGPVATAEAIRTVSGPAIGLALNSQGRAWLADPSGGFFLGVVR